MKYFYDAYGNILYQYDSSGIGLANINPFKFNYDNETKFYYLNSRYPQGYSVFCGFNKLMIYVKKMIKNVANHIVLPTVKTVQKNLKESDIGSISTGYYASGAMMVAVSAQVGLTFDQEGNLALQTSGGIGGGIPSISLGRYITQTNAKNYASLNDKGAVIGGSITIPNPYFPVSLGGEYVTSITKDPDKKYSGFTGLAGIGLGPIPFEMHGEMTFTGTLFDINIFDIIYSTIDDINEW